MGPQDWNNGTAVHSLGFLYLPYMPGWVLESQLRATRNGEGPRKGDVQWGLSRKTHP